MRKFFDPKSVAVIGVPRKTGTGAYNNVEAIINYGYKGHIYPVNPKAEEICGLKSYPSVLEVPQPVDLAVISVGRDRVLPIFEECVQAGIQRVIIVSQGFAEADARGAKLQEQIVSLAREHEVRVLGPNTMGVLNNFRNLNISFGSRSVSEKVPQVSLISQTGMMLWAPVRFGYQDWGKAIDIGNSCDVDFVDALEYFDNDPETQVIVMHMEGIKRGEEFLKTAARITNHKPVIVLKTGRSKAGAKSAVSHTASLVGEDEVFDAAFRRAGIIRVKNGSELRDAVRALLLLQEMEGPRLGIITITGAAGIMSLDACEDFGLRPADIPPTLSQKLEEGMPDWLRIENPADIWPVAMIGGNFVEIYGKTIAQLLQSPEVDGILAIAYATLSSDSSFYPFLGLIDAIAEIRHKTGSNKPIAIWTYLEDIASVATITDKCESIPGAACFDSVEQAVQGLSFCYRYHRIRHRKVPYIRSFPIDRQHLDPLLKRGRVRKILTGEDALSLLAAFGIPVVRGLLVRNWEELEAASGNLIYPLVLKPADSRFLHKSEWGGVMTGIGDLDELRRAFHTITENVRSRDPAARIDTFHLQEQAVGKELLLGLKRDPQFGQIIACGFGGIYTEVFQDISREIVPVDRSQAEKMLQSLKIYPLLQGVRGEAGVKMEALIETLERLSFLAGVVPDIAELDINPLLAAGDGCKAADSRILW